MDRNSKVCRACLGCCPQEYYSLNHGTPSYQFKLQECVPFMDLKMILDPIICVTCAVMLDRSYQLLIVARNVEARLFSYLNNISRVGTYYIMAEKPDGPILEHLEYHTVVDDAYNFRMVVAMAAKADISEDSQRAKVVQIEGVSIVQIQQIPLDMIKVENVDRDYDEYEQMPNIELMMNLTEAPNFSPERTISPSPRTISTPPISHFDPAINQQNIPSLQIDSNTTANHASNKLSDSDTSGQQIISQSDIFIPNNAADDFLPKKTLHKSKSSNVHHCPICKCLFSNLPIHMRVHFDLNKMVRYRKADAMSDIRGVLASMSLPPIACLQCGCDYFVNDGHKCLFSSYVRLDRSASLDSMARTLIDPQLAMHQQKNAIDLSADDLSDDSKMIQDEQTDEANSTTLTALSVCDDGGDLLTTAQKPDRRDTCQCVHCQLRFDNSVQLNRHLSLRHTCADGNNDNCDDSSPLVSIHDEHSYAKLKSIQCWNCPHTFATCENWLKHDYSHHKTIFFICYICLRGYSHTQIIRHLTTTHSLTLHDQHNILQTLPRRDLPTQSCRLDDTFRRMATFVMHEHKLTHCPLCQQSWGSPSLLIRHLLLSSCTVAKCMLCQIDVDSSLHLVQHLMTMVHKRKAIQAYDKSNERYLCQVCDAVFAMDVAFIEHTCGAECNPFILYRQKMGLWECSMCSIMSPLGLAAKQQHLLSAVHLKHKLEHLLSSASSISDLRCHLCAPSDPYTNKSTLFEHLLSFHVEALTVLCPLCHFMTLNPDQYTDHLQRIHPNFLNQRFGSLTKPSAAIKYCPDEFTCLLCKRKHWTLNSFWATCGKGHKQRFSLEITLRYLATFKERKWLHFNGTLYTCECGQKLQNGAYLYKHYKYADGDLARCSFWSCCDLCGALISPRSKLDRHKEVEHCDRSKPVKIRCKNQSELLDTAKGPAMNDAPLLGKRKRRKNRAYIDEDVCEEHSAKIDNKQQRRNKKIIAADDDFIEIKLSDVDRINDPHMQPILCLEKLPLSNTLPYGDESARIKSSMKSIAHLHMIEAIERVVTFTGTNDDAIGVCIDDDRSSCSSDQPQLEDPLALDAELSTNDREENQKILIIHSIIDEELRKNQLEIPAPFIKPKCEQLNIINDDIDHSEDNLFTFPVEMLLDSKEDGLIFNCKLDIDDLINEKIQSEIKCELINDAIKEYDNSIVIEENSGNSGRLIESAVKNTIKNTCQTDRTTTANAHPGQQSTAQPSVKIIYKCDRCHLLAASRTELTTHSCRLSKIDIVQCAYCQKDFLNDTKLHAHMLHEHSTFHGRIPRIDGINGCVVDKRDIVEQPRDGAGGGGGLIMPSSSDGQVVSVVSQSGVTQKVKQATTTAARKQVMIRCSLCQQLFENMKVLIVHMKTNHFPSICIHCDDKFANSDNLSRHLEACVSALRNRELNRIIFYDQTAPSVAENINNSDIRNDDSSLPDTSAIHYNIFRCLDCDLLLPGFYVAKEHFSNLHKDAAGDVYSCQMCDAFAVDMQMMKHHKELHRDGAFNCIVCQRVFKGFVDYKVHYNEHKMASCPHCPRMFLDMYELRAHIADLHGGATKMK